MDDSQWTWPLALLGDLAEVVAIVAIVVVLGALGLRVLPSTRRWAPRGNARPARPGSATRVSEPGSPQEPARGVHPATSAGLSQRGPIVGGPYRQFVPDDRD